MVVQEVEDQRVQHRQRRVADSATVVAGLVRAAVEVAGAVPEAHGGLLGQGREPDGLGDAAGPDRPGGVGAGQRREAGQWRQQVAERGHVALSGVDPCLLALAAARRAARPGADLLGVG